MSHNNLLIIGFVWPEPKSSAAGSRMLQLIHQFQKQGFSITFASAANNSDKAFDLKSIGVDIAHIKINDTSFNTFIKQLNPDIVVFDRFMTEEQFGWRVSENCPKALKILDTEDFHGLRKGREEAFKNNVPFSVKYLHNTTTKREIASIYRCDLSLIISEAEQYILLQKFKIDSNLLYYVPFLIESTSHIEIAELPKFENRQHFITIGNFLHPPNYDAVVHLKNNIWPLIRKQLPKAELHIYGAYESQKVSQLHNERDGFLIKGFAEDVNVVMQKAKVCLAPLRFGAGLKGKLIDAMKNGTPAVMSTIASEGIFGPLPVNGFINDDSHVFAESAITLYNDKEDWKLRQQLGFSILKERFNMANFQQSFKDKIESLQNNLETHRQNNFIGQMLMHHSLQSTKYLSKWIEEKNK